jgi:hypothetical protein
VLGEIKMTIRSQKPLALENLRKTFYHLFWKKVWTVWTSKKDVTLS